MNRTTFLVDGFNLYHSIKQASKDNRKAQIKWLDLKSLCNSYLYVVGQKTDQRATLANVHFFSAIVDHLVTPTNPNIVNRQKLYIRCLKDSGIKVELVGFPYARKNSELAKLAPSFTITDQAYMKHQFADPVTLKNGKRINKPAKW